MFKPARFSNPSSPSGINFTPLQAGGTQIYTPQVGLPVSSRLINGSTGWFQQVPFRHHSSLTILLPIGPAIPGVMGLLPLILMEGSQTRRQLINWFNSQGILGSVLPDGDKVRLTLSCPAGMEPQLISAAATLLLRPNVDPALFNTLREDGVKSLQRILNSPELRLFQAVNKSLYGANHPYAKSGKELINDLSFQSPQSVLAVLNQALQSPQGVSWMMVSPQPLAVQKAMIESGIQQAGWFGGMPGIMGTLPVAPPVAYARGIAPMVLLPDETVKRASLLQAWRAPTMNDPDYAAFLVLIKLLQGPAGKFFQVLRTEKGLVYSTTDEYTVQKQGADYNVSTQVDFDKIGPGLYAIQQVIQSICSMPISGNELLKAKKGITLELRGTMQSTDGIAALGIPRLRLDLPLKHPDELRQEIDRITPQDIQRIAQRFLNPANGYQVTGVVAPTAILSHWFPGQALTSAFPRELFSGLSSIGGLR